MPVDTAAVTRILQAHHEAALTEINALVATDSSAPISGPATASVDVLFVGDELPRAQIAQRMGTRTYAMCGWGSLPRIGVRTRVVAMTSSRTQIEQLIARFPTSWLINWAMPTTSIELSQHDWRMQKSVGWIDLQADTHDRVRDPVRLAAALTQEWAAAAPPAPPAAAPAPAAPLLNTGVLDRVIACSAGLNEIVVPAGGPPGSAWRRGGSSTLGARLQYADLPDWVPLGSVAGQWATMLLPWGVISRDASFVGQDTWVEVRAADLLVVRRGVSRAERLRGYPLQTPGWAAVFGFDLASLLRDTIESRPAADGQGISMRVPVDGALHFAFGKVAVPFPDAIEGIVALFEVRRDPRSAPGRLGVECGVDPYPGDGTLASYGMPWAAACGGSAFVTVTDHWQTVGYATVPNSLTGGDNPTNRLTSVERLRSAVGVA